MRACDPGITGKGQVPVTCNPLLEERPCLTLGLSDLLVR